MPLLPDGPFVRASACGEGSNCVEVRHDTRDGIVVRDSKDPDGPTLQFTPQQWADFLTEVRRGRHDV